MRDIPLSTAFFVTAALAIGLPFCARPLPHPLPPEPDVVIVPPGPEGAAPATCASACARLRDLHCPEGDGFDGGDTCEAVCAHVVATGVTSIALDCIAAASSTGEVRACRVRCPLP